MNKQIKELYTQVCMEQNLPFTVEYNSAVMLDAFANKFAELIVRECIDIINYRADTCGDRLDSIKANEAVREGQRECAKTIKEHFGVEE